MTFPEKEKNPLNPGGKEYEIPAEGSLGILALGAKGLDLWRKKKEALKNQKGQQPAGENHEKA